MRSSCLRSLLQPISAAAQLFMGAAAFFAGVGGELDAIDGKRVSANQSLGITGHQNLAEQGFDLGAEVGLELGDVGMARLAVTADGNELDVALACLFDGSAGDQALSAWLYFLHPSFNLTARLAAGLGPLHMVNTIRHKVPMRLKLKLLIRQGIRQ